MKKIVSSLIMLSMLVTIILPLGVFAGEQSKELEQVINIAKQKINVPSNLSEFTYGVNNNDGTNIWNLSWTGKDNSEGSLNISIKADGTIQNYYFYKYNESNTDYGKFPKTSREQAEKIALDFIKKVNPDVINQIKLDENYNQNVIETTQNFSYIRVYNNILLRSNSISVGVDLQEGYVQNYNFNWTNDLVFPDTSKVIALDSAKKAYAEKLGLKLQYEYRVEDKKIVTYPVYVQKDTNYYINALTGEKVELERSYYGPYYEADSKAMNGARNDKLSPEEQKAVDEASNLLTKDEAEKIVRNTKHLELSADYKLENASLYKDYLPTGVLNWNMSFVKSENETDTKYVYVQVDAKTKEISSFSMGASPSDEKSKIDRDTARIKAETFLKEFCDDKFNMTEYDENYEGNIYPYLSSDLKDLPREYSFRYLRKVNGVPFTGNWLAVRYDAVADKVLYFESSWFNADFKSINNILPVDKAHDILFNEIGYGLEHKLKNNTENNLKYGTDSAKAKPEVYLVYAPNPAKPLRIDPYKGTILDYNGSPYKDKTAAKYTDVAYSFARNQINTLADYGISFEGKKFLPEKVITQKEFLFLLAKSVNPYDSYSLTDKSDIDKMYKNLISRGIIKKNEKAPNAKVSKETAVKFIIRTMNYDKVADLKGIYACDFKDNSDIKPELIGYIAIAKGFKIISGDDGYLYPKQSLTREQAAVIIYNYLSR